MNTNDSGHAPQHSPSRRGTSLPKKLIALIATVSMALIGLVGVVAAPVASAHSNAVSGVFACQDDGTWLITWTVANDYNATASITASNRPAVVPVGTSFAKYGTKTFTETVTTTGSRTLTITTLWSDNYSQGNSGSVNVTGTCVPKSWSATATKTLTKDICYNDGNVHISVTGNGSATSTVSQVDAQTKADAAAATDAATKLATELAKYPGYKDGTCSWSATATKTLTKDICYNGENVHISVTGNGSATSTVSSGDAQTKADAAAATDASTKMNAELAKYPGYKDGTCTYSAEASKTLTKDICYNGENIHISVTGNGSATSKVSHNDAQDKADALAATDAQNKLDAELAKYSGYKDGTCTYSADASKTLTKDICYNGENIHISVTGNGSATSKVSQQDAQDKADALAATDAQNKLAAQLGNYEGYKDGTCTYSADASKTLAMDICYKGENVHISVTGNGSATSKVSQKDAQDKADALAATDAQNKLDAELSNYEGYVEGTCTYSADASKTLTQDICYNGENVHISVTGTGTATSKESPADAQAKADALAAIDAQNKLDAELSNYEGYVDGTCTYSADASKTLTMDICYKGENVNVSVTGTGSATSKESQDAAQAAADAAAAADAQAKMTAALSQYEGYVEGTCTYSADASKDLSKDICYNGESITVNVTGTGSATSKESQDAAQALADAAAAADAQTKMTTALAQYPGYVEGTCSVPVPFTATASTARVLDICYNGANLTVSATGSGGGSSLVSAQDAQNQADAAATAQLNTNLAAALAKYPGYVEGKCVVVPTVVEPGTVTPPPVDVVVPEAGTVPETVPIPEAATIPESVPAGGGSSAPGSQLPPWALALMVAGGLGVITAATRIATNRRK